MWTVIIWQEYRVVIDWDDIKHKTGMTGTDKKALFLLSFVDICGWGSSVHELFVNDLNMI